jgi:glycosyltransferase involved in cell wall biosynthesis
MRIAFADFLDSDFNVQSVDSIPMGGAQSAACHLARALAWLGHEVLFINQRSNPVKYDGVTCVSWKHINPAQLAAYGVEAVICIGEARFGLTLRETFGPGTRVILWNHHAANQASVQALHDPGNREAFDGQAFVSQWQRDDFARVFGIGMEKSAISRNAVAPAFLNQFPARSPILPEKAWPPILAYTSTPFRGLDILLEAFGPIRAAVPGTRLQVFSSMKVYQVSSEQDEAQYGRLYDQCRKTEGVEYFGSVSQPELARALRPAMMLAYPNTFAETSCIAVMEAMASGCRVVTSAFGALPETTAGFARLIPVDKPSEYLGQFVQQVVEGLLECRLGGAELERSLRAQMDYINSKATWKLRAGEWVQWLKTLPAGGARSSRPIS